MFCTHCMYCNNAIGKQYILPQHFSGIFFGFRDVKPQFTMGDKAINVKSVVPIYDHLHNTK